MMALHPQRQNRLVFDYEPAKVRVVDNGHTIQVNVPSGSVLRLNDRDYMLGQFHFHEPSEHHLDGQAYPMEMHLVHRDQKGHLVVVAILIETGAPHQALAALWSMLPTKVGEQISEQTFNPQDLLPASTHHFTYHGSLTTPPCTEGVQWIILRDPITLAKEQIAKFVSVIGHNARPVQPLRGRKVLEE
jgi:carbonic anhydrase